MAKPFPKLPGPWNGHFGQAIYEFLQNFKPKKDVNKFIKLCSAPIFQSTLKELNLYYLFIWGLIQTESDVWKLPDTDEDGWLSSYDAKCLSFRVDRKTHRLMPLKRDIIVAISFDGTYFTIHNHPGVNITGDVIHIDSLKFNVPFDLERAIFHEMMHALYFNRRVRKRTSARSSSKKRTLSIHINSYIKEESDVRKEEKKFARTIKDKRADVKFENLKTIEEKINWGSKDHQTGAVERSFRSKEPILNLKKKDCWLHKKS
ncbi:hypothetical protein ES708_26674 [subsurface metagenome]